MKLDCYPTTLPGHWHGRHPFTYGDLRALNITVLLIGEMLHSGQNGQAGFVQARGRVVAVRLFADSPSTEVEPPDL
jgi:hypothetical protein